MGREVGLGEQEMRELDELTKSEPVAMKGRAAGAEADTAVGAEDAGAEGDDDTGVQGVAGADAGAVAPVKTPKLWMVRSGAFECESEEELGASGLWLENKKYFSNGNRGVIYTAELQSDEGSRRKVAIKELLHEKLRKPGRVYMSSSLHNESYWLKRLNEHGIGPDLLYADDSKVVMEFVEGERILTYLDGQQCIKACVQTLLEVMKQLRYLDALGIQKGELVKPDRHVLINQVGVPVLIDFERCKETSSPQNVTQFCQFLLSKRLTCALENSRGMEQASINLCALRQLCQEYKASGLGEAAYLQMIQIISAVRAEPRR